MAGMSTAIALAIALGTCLGCGLWLVLMSLPRFGAIPLHLRVAPYVADISSQAFVDATKRTDVHRNSRGGLRRLNSLLHDVASRNTPSSAVALKLTQAAWGMSESEFQARRYIWALIGTGFGIVVDAILGLSVQPPLASLVLIPLLVGATGYVALGTLLSRAAAKRTRSIEEEIPAIWEFLSLCVAAGESLPDALARVVRIGRGPAIEELRRTVLSVETGASLVGALTQLETRLRIPPLSRGIEQILGALNKGAPLASVLSDQALDAREDSKRALLESAGKKEVAMLVPLVFLILPITILFAVFPGLLVIQAGF